MGFPGGSEVKNLVANAGEAIDKGSIPGLGRTPGEGKSYPLQYSGLENSRDCIVRGVMKSQTRLSNSVLSLCVYFTLTATLEEDMAIHSSILAWKIPWSEKPGRP